MGDPLGQKLKQRRLNEVKKGKNNLKKLEELVRNHWADHSTRMPEPVPHRRMRLKPLKVVIPSKFYGEKDYDQWQPTVVSEPIAQPPGGFGPIRASMEDQSTTVGSLQSVDGMLSLPHTFITGEGRVSLNLDPKFYEFSPRELVKPFMQTGPLMSKGPQYRPAKPAEHSHRLTDVYRRPSLLNRDINIQRKRPSLTKTNLVSSSFGTVEVMKLRLPELVETEPEKAVLPEVTDFDPTALKRENTIYLLSRVDKMLNVNKQTAKYAEDDSVGSVHAETPNLLDLKSDFSEGEYLPDVVPRQRHVVGCDAEGDMLQLQGLVTGSYRPSDVNVKLKCLDWLQEQVIK